MRDDASKVAEILRRHKNVRVVTHIDADGICAGAIASLALERAGIGCDVQFVKQLDPETVEKLNARVPGAGSRVTTTTYDGRRVRYPAPGPRHPAPSSGSPTWAPDSWTCSKAWTAS